MQFLEFSWRAVALHLLLGGGASSKKSASIESPSSTCLTWVFFKLYIGVTSPM